MTSSEITHSATTPEDRFNALRDAFQNWANALWSYAGPTDMLSSHTVASHIEHILENEAETNG